MCLLNILMSHTNSLLNYTVNHYRMAAKGAIGVSIDGGPVMVVSNDSIYGRIYHEVRDRYLM